MNQPVVIFHDLAEGELNEAAQYYESKVPGLGSAFLSEIERSIEQIRHYPEAAPFILKGSSSIAKVGTKVRNIRLVEGDHNIDCKIDGIGAMKLKSEFVKKA